LDLHGGGQDLIFPHHENEIAQSESYTGKPFARFWLHNGLITVEGQKMSKSLGNYTTIREILRGCSPMSLRFFLLYAHYRRPLDFSMRALGDAAKGFSKIQNTIFNIKGALSSAPKAGAGGLNTEVVNREFHQALEDDFNTPQALAAIFRFIREINAYLSESPGRFGLENALSTILELTAVLGLRFETEVPERLIEMLDEKILLRANLRRNQDYAGADKIRKSLLEEGILLEDRGDRTMWRFTKP
ncbi:MAG: DALR domain-containing protein, partial [Candidatus Hydrothermarchaeales archaeon]